MHETNEGADQKVPASHNFENIVSVRRMNDSNEGFNEGVFLLECPNVGDANTTAVGATGVYLI